MVCFLRRVSAILLITVLALPAVGFAAKDPYRNSVRPLQVAGTDITFCTAFSINEREGLWATAAHCAAVPVREKIDFTVDGYRAHILYVDPVWDLAVVQSAAKEKAFTLATRPLEVSERIEIRGYPYGLWNRVTVHGEVAALTVHGLNNFPSDLLNATIAGGNSGSPVLRKGEIVGLVWGMMVDRDYAISVPLEAVRRQLGGYWEK